MKASDIALAIFIAFFSVLISYWVGGMILGDPNEKFEKIEFAVPISSSVVQPDKNVFNPYAKNPTVEVITGDCPAGQHRVDDGVNTCVDDCPEGQHNEEGTGICVDDLTGKPDSGGNNPTPEQ